MLRLTFLLLLLLVLFSPYFVKAVDLGGLKETAGITNLNKTPADPTAVVSKVLNPVLSFVGVLFFGLMVYAGALWMTAAGDEKKVDQAKQIILAAVIGLVIVGAAYAITKFIGQSLNTSQTTTNTP